MWQNPKSLGFIVSPLETMYLSMASRVFVTSFHWVQLTWRHQYSGLFWCVIECADGLWYLGLCYEQRINILPDTGWWIYPVVSSIWVLTAFDPSCYDYEKENALTRSITAYYLSKSMLICSSKYKMTDVAATFGTTIWSNLQKSTVICYDPPRRLVNYMGLWQRTTTSAFFNSVRLTLIFATITGMCHYFWFTILVERGSFQGVYWPFYSIALSL